MKAAEPESDTICYFNTHLHIQSKENRRIEGKDFAIQLFPRSDRQKRVEWHSWGYHATYTGNMVKETSQDLINKHFSTFCGVLTFKHKTEEASQQTFFFSRRKEFLKGKSINSRSQKTAVYSAHINPAKKLP